MSGEDREIIPRIMRDMNDGVLVLDMQGTILYLNEQGRKLLGEGQNPVGRKYAAAFMTRNVQEKNDTFHQFILDAVYDKDHTHSGEVSYQPPGSGSVAVAAYILLPAQ